MRYDGGVLAANLVSFTSNDTLDREDMKRQIERLAGYDGVRGFVANAFAGEGPTLSDNERLDVIALHREYAREDQPVVAAILDISTRGAVAQAKAAKSAGASALLICPPIASSWSAHASPDIAVAYHHEIAAATDLPIILFQLAVGDPTSYSHDLLMSLVSDIPSVFAVKMAQANDAVRYDQDFIALKGLPREILCFPAVGSAMFANLATGSDGLLTGLVCLFPEEVTELYAAAARGDFDRAREIHFRLAAINLAIYRQPYVDLHTRYKELAYSLGAVASPAVRGPQMRVSDVERKVLNGLLRDAGFIDDDAIRFAGE